MSSAAVVVGALSVKIIALVLMIGPDVLNALHAGKFHESFSVAYNEQQLLSSSDKLNLQRV